MPAINNSANPSGGDPAVVIPWQPCNLPMALQNELNRRKKNRSLRYIEANKGDWEKSDGQWTTYRGPMVPWVRLCSNSNGRMSGPDAGKPGFVFFGGKGFYNEYGFTAAKNRPSVIGYLPDGKATHTIDNDLNADYPIHVPAPEIEKISVTIQKELYRRASIDWVCFSKRQLEYMTPYFLVPGISCIMEWGWNHYNPASLVDLTNIGDLQNKFNNPYPLYTKNILSSNGNYDVIFGIVTNFEWTVDGNKFRCHTEITSKDRIYSGLIVSSNAADKSADSDSQETSEKPFDSLIQFVDKSLGLFNNVFSTPPDSIPEISEFAKYVRSVHPNNADEYLYGVFYGRELKDTQNKYQPNLNTSHDFDCPNKHKELWLNLGLVIEAINFHAGPLKAMKGKEMFHVDIDDVVVGGHPNMISSDGTICLIPNSKSPHYFYGKYGPQDKIEKLLPSDSGPLSSPASLRAAITANVAPNWKLQNVCGQYGGAYRDDIDQIINAFRYERGIAVGSCAFPFQSPHPSPANKPYPANYSGYLKHIYVSLSFIKGLLDNSSDIQTYSQLIEKMLEGINGACGSFWDFRLISAPGDHALGPQESAPMKIVDDKFMAFGNGGKVWTFDYYDADSLLLGIGFKPTLSNAQAIRTIYAQTNNPSGAKTTITNGNNELLDYQFTDRLKLADNVGDTPTPKADTSGFYDTMRSLQQVEPSEAGTYYQITTGANVYRLALPANDVQLMLLDDTDEDNNPKYTGVMPGIQATFTIQGIGGLRTFMMFLVRNLPEPYSEKNIVFRIVNLEESIDAGNWTTTITAGVIPLRAFIKNRLGIT
jgi:hypothetical protein